MPTAWSDKDERKYEHIKESGLESRTHDELYNRARSWASKVGAG